MLKIFFSHSLSFPLQKSPAWFSNSFIQTIVYLCWSSVGKSSFPSPQPRSNTFWRIAPTCWHTNTSICSTATAHLVTLLPPDNLFWGVETAAMACCAIVLIRCRSLPGPPLLIHPKFPSVMAYVYAGMTGVAGKDYLVPIINWDKHS